MRWSPPTDTLVTGWHTNIGHEEIASHWQCLTLVTASDTSIWLEVITNSALLYFTSNRHGVITYHWYCITLVTGCDIGKTMRGSCITGCRKFGKAFSVPTELMPMEICVTSLFPDSVQASWPPLIPLSSIGLVVQADCFSGRCYFY